MLKLSNTSIVFLTIWITALSLFLFRLVWVPGHSGFDENCKVDELTREGTLTPISIDWKQYYIVILRSSA